MSEEERELNSFETRKEEEEALASILLSKYLIWSVIVSLVIITFGTVEYLITGSSGYVKLPLSALIKAGGTSVTAFPHLVPDVLLGTIKVKSFAIMQFGLLLLLLSPFGRVLLQIFIFVKEKDKYFIPIGVAVFIILLFSLYASRFLA